jgi:hypothetical protein
MERPAFVGLEHVLDRPIHDELAVVEPDRAGAQGLQRTEGVGDAENGAALIANFVDFVHALGLELLIADGEYFVDDQNLGLKVYGDTEGEAEHHAIGIGAEGLVDEVVQFRKLDDGLI